MKKHHLLALVAIAVFFSGVSAQTAPRLKRTIFKNDRLDFGVGGTLAVIGAPNGSIRVEGWSNREIEISAEIEIQADSEADLNKLATVTTFVLQESLGRTGIISVGTHDKKLLKQIDKKFPKKLLGLPFRIDYVVKVPKYTDLQIDGGKGDLTVSGVEGTLKLNYLETNARLDLVGGGTLAVFGKGKVEVRVPSSSWRGRYTEVSVAQGELSVSLPANLNAEVDATILRIGKIQNSYTGFKPRVRKAEFTEKSIVAKSGVGGGNTLKFTVGDGTLTITESDGKAAVLKRDERP